jgi:hypothetical protein
MTAVPDDAKFLEACRQAEATVRETLDPKATVPLGWIEQGAKCHYPGCCILFFCTVWQEWLDREHRGGDDMAHRYKGMLKRVGWPADGYIPCPACVARRTRLARPASS